MTGFNPTMSDVETFEGRALAKPDEPLVDQGLQFDLVTLLGRRGLLRVLGIGAVGAGVSACGLGGSTNSAGTSGAASSATASGTGTAQATGEIPEETSGPYPGDGSNGPDVLQQSGVVRSDISRSFGSSTALAPGTPLTLTMNIKDLANGGAAMTGAAVYVWHCDAEGRYSMYSDGVTGENFLRGVQIADKRGQVSFTTVFPGCYAGRWPHVHFEIYPDSSSITDSGNAIATSQLAFPQDICDEVYRLASYPNSAANLAQLSLATDMVFSDGVEHQLGSITGEIEAGLAVSLSVAIDTTTPAGAGSMGAPRGGPAGSPPPPPPSQ